MPSFKFSSFQFSPPGLSVVGLALALLLALSPLATAQGTSGTINGTVTDASNAVVPGATVVIANPVSGYSRTTTTDGTGQFKFPNLPLNNYRVTISFKGFQTVSKSVPVSSIVPVAFPVTLTVATSNEVVNVDATSDLLQTDSTAHTDIDRSLIERIPMESASSGLSSIVTLASPGVSADSNGQMHGLGDHAENSFSLDGQPITDQQSKAFSNQLPSSAVQSLEVIDGAPPAEYGDKTSLVVKATTRSGQGITTPTGAVTLSYGTFGSSDLSVDVAYGGKNWGNFIAASGLQSGRFLDAPEFAVYHDKGNQENFFDRVDNQVNSRSSIHTNLQYTRSWFQTPNSYDTQYGFVQSGATTAPTDQRSKIETFDIAPSYTNTINNETVFNVGTYLRRDAFNYNPSRNALSDLGPIQQESVSQFRTLTNLGTHADVTYVKGVNNAKLGGMYQQTFLRESFQLGIVDPLLNAPCVSNLTGQPVAGQTPQCIGNAPNPAYNPVLAPYDLTRAGAAYTFRGRTDVKQLAFYGQDQITKGNWLFNVGIRGDFYNGLSIQRQAEPRIGISPTRSRIPEPCSAPQLRAYAGNTLQRKPRTIQSKAA